MPGSFYDEFTDSSGGSFVGKEEKEELIASATPFSISHVALVESQWGKKYNVSVDLDGEDRIISFTTESVESRDRMLSALRDYIETKGAPDDQFKLVRVGRSILVKNANED